MRADHSNHWLVLSPTGGIEIANVVLYSTGCPRCKALEQALNRAGIVYDYCDNIDTIAGLGVKYVPVLEVNGDLMDYPAALGWINGGGAA